MIYYADEIFIIALYELQYTGSSAQIATLKLLILCWQSINLFKRVFSCRFKNDHGISPSFRHVEIRYIRLTSSYSIPKAHTARDKPVLNTNPEKVVGLVLVTQGQSGDAPPSQFRVLPRKRTAAIIIGV